MLHKPYIVPSCMYLTPDTKACRSVTGTGETEQTGHRPILLDIRMDKPVDLVSGRRQLIDLFKLLYISSQLGFRMGEVDGVRICFGKIDLLKRCRSPGDIIGALQVLQIVQVPPAGI